VRAEASEQPSVFIAVFPAAAGSQTCTAPYRFRINRSNLCAAAPLGQAWVGWQRYPGVSSAWWSDYDARLAGGRGSA
jgi:hypothetical protein